MLYTANVQGSRMVIFEILEFDDRVFINSVINLLTDAETTNRYKGITLRASESVKVPFMQSNMESVDIPNIYVTCTNNTVDKLESALESSPTLLEAFKQQLKVSRLTNEDVIKIKEVIDVFNRYVNGDLPCKIILPVPCYRGEMGLLKRLVATIGAKTGVSSDIDMDTLFRESPNDKLSISIPSLQALMFGTYSVPNFSDVFNPLYGNDMLNNYKYPQALELLPESQKIPVEYVIGSPNNITSEIFPEEQEYYDNLKSLHIACLRQEHPDRTVEDYEKYNVFSKVFLEYITELVLDVIGYHWNQGGAVSVVRVSESDDSDSDDSMLSEETAKKDMAVSAMKDLGYKIRGAGAGSGDGEAVQVFHFRAPGHTDMPLGEDLIPRLLETQSAKDIYAPIKILIQLLRFGEKKPRKIALEEGRYLDLLNLTFSSKSGNFSQYVPKLNSDGSTYSILSLITLHSRLEDTAFIRDSEIRTRRIDNLPVGLVLLQEYEGTDDYRQIFISLVDLIENCNKDKNLTVKGVSVSPNGKVTIDKDCMDEDMFYLKSENMIGLPAVVTALRQDSDFTSSVYTSSSFKEVLIKNGCNRNDLSNLTILNDNIRSSLLHQQVHNYVSTQEDLDDTIRMTGASRERFIVSKISADICTLTARVNDECTDIINNTFSINLQQVIDSYETHMASEGYRGYVFALDETEVKADEPKEQVVEQSNVFVIDGDDEDIDLDYNVENNEEDDDTLAVRFKDRVGINPPNDPINAIKLLVPLESVPMFREQYNGLTGSTDDVVVENLSTPKGEFCAVFYAIQSESTKSFWLTTDLTKFKEIINSNAGKVKVSAKLIGAFKKVPYTFNNSLITGEDSAVTFGSEKDYVKITSMILAYYAKDGVFVPKK